MTSDVRILLLSGGLDSTTLLYECLSAGQTVEALFVNYGQRMALVEERAVRSICEQVNVPVHVVTCPLPRSLASGWLVDPPETPEWQSHLVTDLPHRNLLLLTLGAMLATQRRATAVCLGIIDIEATPFPDSTEAFINAVDHVVRLSTPNIAVEAPYLSWTKRQVAARAMELKVPVDLTFSCTYAEDHHCMECPSCIDRADALSFVSDNKRQGNTNV